MKTDVEHAIKAALREIDYYNEIIAEWQADLATDPQAACEWADKMFEAAAAKSALIIIKSMLKKIGKEDGISVQDYNAWLRGVAQRMVRDGLEASSTSATHNLAKKKQGAAWYRLGVDDNWNRHYLIQE